MAAGATLTCGAQPSMFCAPVLNVDDTTPAGLRSVPAKQQRLEVTERVISLLVCTNQPHHCITANGGFRCLACHSIKMIEFMRSFTTIGQCSTAQAFSLYRFRSHSMEPFSMNNLLGRQWNCGTSSLRRTGQGSFQIPYGSLRRTQHHPERT